MSVKVLLLEYVSHGANIPRTGLARSLSKLGLCSRKQAFAFIRAGRVRLNGTLVRDPEKPVRLGKDTIEVDGKRVGPAGKVYLMLNKPRGLVTTARDEKGRKTIYSLLPDHKDWLAPVGRLDMASEGLLLLTNDSLWGARIASPESHVDKTYHVQIDAVADHELICKLQNGISTAKGDFLAFKHASILRVGQKNSWLEIVLDEGKNRHIRRMLSELGIEVLRLVRIAVGPVELGDLPKGKTRPLTDEERETLEGKNDCGATGALARPPRYPRVMG
jgi:23S rRNA pseudouridine2605 synthase